MANTPKKITDPTEAALSAIQDALTARDNAAEPEPGTSPSPVAGEPRTSISQPAQEPLAVEADELSWHTVRADAPLGEEQAQEQSALRPPANDDRESIGAILGS